VDLIKFFRTFTERVAAVVLKKPPVVIAIVGVIALAGALGALRLNPDTGVESITGSSSSTYKATQEWSKTFGGDPIVVLVQGPLPKMMLGSDLGVLAGLEGCLSGNIPTSAQAQTDIPQICRQIGKFKPAVAVYGPGTFVNTAALSVTEGIKQVQARAKARGEEAGKAAAEIARKQGQPELAQQQAKEAAQQVAQLEALRDSLKLGQEYGLSVSNPPSLTNQAFVAQLIFDPSKGSDVPKSRFNYLFPNKNSAVIQVRLRPDMTPAQRAEAVDLVKRATANSKYQLQYGKYLVTGAPVVLTGIQDSIEKAIVTLLIAALIVMGLALMLVFPAELRLLPLALALMAAALTYGLLALTGSSIGVGAVAVLPVLVGLAVDYAIQFHARADQAMRDGADAPAAVMKAASGGGPPVLAAATATIAALLALALSPVPLVRGFGLLLVVGVALAITVVLTAGFATLGWAGGATREKPRRKPAETVAGWLRIRTLFNHIVARPTRILAIASVLAVLGWAAGLLSPVTTDIRQLVPNSLAAVRDAETLRKSTGATGEVDVLVKAKDVTDPKVIAWMQKFQAQVLADAGYKGEQPSCAKADLCPALSLSDLFRNQQLTKARIRQLLASVGDFSRGVVSPGKRQATIAFGLRKESLNDQKKTIDRMRDRLDPPAGVTAQVVGLNALAADASGSLSNPLRRLLIAVTALLLLFLVIFAVTRKWRRAAPPVLSVAIAAGISALLLFIIRVPLNPMSAALGVFIIAIAGEFTLLIYMQYLRERADDAKAGVEAAFRRSYKTTGPAVFASGVTAIAGFLALAVSDINMLRGFALVAVVDLSVALLSTVLLLPAVTLWLEGRDTGGDASPKAEAPRPAEPEPETPELEPVATR
jgi:hydrophobe/amphiphile efflux-3 (HAE3) family protein